MDAAAAVAQLTPLIDQAAAGERKADIGMYFAASDTVRRALLTRMAAAVDRLAPSGPYREQAADALNNPSAYSDTVLVMAGVLDALRDDYRAGYLRSVEELIHADVFADFLEMAEELHSKKYKDPAAVIAGSVLEEHLRKLAVAHGVAIETGGKPKKADTINADLKKVGAYNALEQKSVTAWLGLRNDAAHGKYGEYDHAQVAALIRDVRGFMVRHPA